MSDHDERLKGHKMLRGFAVRESSAPYLEAEKARLRVAVGTCRLDQHSGIRFVAWDKAEADALKAYMAKIAPEIPFEVSWCDWDAKPPPCVP